MFAFESNSHFDVTKKIRPSKDGLRSEEINKMIVDIDFTTPSLYGATSNRMQRQEKILKQQQKRQKNDNKENQKNNKRTTKTTSKKTTTSKKKGGIPEKRGISWNVEFAKK